VERQHTGPAAGDRIGTVADPDIVPAAEPGLLRGDFVPLSAALAVGKCLAERQLMIVDKSL
jgi:hypothetical protein